MQEIKFRAWDKVEQAWHYFTLHNLRTYAALFEQHLLEGDEFYLSTGLKDRTGKGIYEGDILSFDKRAWGGEGSTFVIRWNDKAAAFLGKGAPFDWTVYCQVIGNIYETPELLKERTDA